MRRKYFADLAENLELTEKELRTCIIQAIIFLPIVIVFVYSIFAVGFVLMGEML